MCCRCNPFLHNTTILPLPTSASCYLNNNIIGFFCCYRLRVFRTLHSKPMAFRSAICSSDSLPDLKLVRCLFTQCPRDGFSWYFCGTRQCPWTTLYCSSCRSLSVQLEGISHSNPIVSKSEIRSSDSLPALRRRRCVFTQCPRDGFSLYLNGTRQFPWMALYASSCRSHSIQLADRSQSNPIASKSAIRSSDSLPIFW